MTVGEISYQNGKENIEIVAGERGQTKSYLKQILFTSFCVCIVLFLISAKFYDEREVLDVSSSSTNKVAFDGQWYIDKHTIATGVGYHAVVRSFMDKYITDSNVDYMYFGCPTTNDTVKVKSYLATHPEATNVMCELHFVDSDQFYDVGDTTGNKTVEEWAQYITDQGSSDFNAFMHNKVQLFVPDLSGHYTAIVEENSLTSILRKSKSLNSTDYDIAHIVVQVPHTGVFYDIVGPLSSIKPRSSQNAFTAWDDDKGECSSSHSLGKSLATYQSLYADVNLEANTEWMESTGMYMPLGISVHVVASSNEYIESTIEFYSSDMGFVTAVSKSDIIIK